MQRDALIEAGVDAERIYEDKASGRKDHRPSACSDHIESRNTRETDVPFLCFAFSRKMRAMKRHCPLP
ncbi:hypothetical protein [Ruegeria atlantica]|uniref:hypothetical protein n=1 Tax=Ruegeria atlantica TaxID=81569 RepID=UPI003F68A15C